MGKNYITFPMGYSWERITSLTPWVTHGIELRAFIACKMPKVGTMCKPYPGKVLCHLPQRDIPEFSRELAMNLI